ncbi:HU family DNA-binding protein [Wolbachia endosymbiont of Cruorifilaria tuberocauda]|uniref:HU family DNA-binding protein n=1 Tax=Wolbachia endosymbiont of Cruorifilaria tuberocauda TaxID=1812111 RepID=UPI001FE6DD18|nr:HU family DNA-binding protein [Wolbachia endosymbiont of Cruorifilaria tuberocauda]
MSKEDSASEIDDILDEIKISLIKGVAVKISTFGTFLVKKMEKSRKGAEYVKKGSDSSKKFGVFMSSKVIKN